MVLQPMDIIIAVCDILIVDQVLKKGKSRLDSVDDKFVKHAAQPHHALDARPAVDDQLTDQAVIVGGMR